LTFDLDAAMASAARQEGGPARLHDTRPLALEAAALASRASRASRSTFPEAFSSVSFINVAASAGEYMEV
jgi:uncharacterized MAPEG superfamily protein